MGCLSLSGRAHVFHAEGANFSPGITIRRVKSDVKDHQPWKTVARLSRQVLT